MMPSTVVRTLIITAGVLVHAGCGGLRTGGPALRFILNRPASGSVQETQSPAPPPAATLEESIGKIRKLMAEARPPAREGVAKTLETSDRELMAALALATAEPTSGNYDALAAIYYQRRLLEQSYDYSRRSLVLDPRGASAHERLARIWRDWGLPHLALTDISRAVYYAPASASARNTLGTILQALGQRTAARQAYSTAIGLDEKAAYAYNNLCYLSFLEGHGNRAIAECQTALALAPQLTAARNNLALTYAAVGRPDLARQEFAQAAGAAATAYNMGVVYLSQQRFEDAAVEFSMAHASQRAEDARRRASEAKTIERGN